jgi:hypothetical protein
MTKYEQLFPKHPVPIRFYQLILSQLNQKKAILVSQTNQNSYLWTLIKQCNQ